VQAGNFEQFDTQSTIVAAILMRQALRVDRKDLRPFLTFDCLVCDWIWLGEILLNFVYQGGG
jgi:hypothetical protein